MTHYTRDYGKLSGLEKEKAALADVRDYLGEDHFNKISEMFRTTYGDAPPTRDSFRLSCSFAGVQGYPCEAWYNYLWIRQKETAG